ncbi:MAG: dual specificity protein phosphatase [candidate division WOR-3 bacterium]
MEISNDVIRSVNQKIIEDYHNSDLVDPITQINQEIFLGQSRTTEYVEILRNLGITHIVSIGQSPHPNTLTANFARFILYDIKDENTENILYYFPSIFHFMRQAIREGGKIYVHCVMGISRSATIVIAFLRANGYFDSLQDAYNYVKNRRPWINPNEGFKTQLRQFFFETLN